MGADATEGPRGAGLLSTAVNLIVCTAGAGVLAFPFAARASSVPVLVAVALSMAALAVYCELILVEEAWRHRRTLHARTFDEVILRSLGRRHYLLAAAQIVVGLFGCLVGFFVVAGDLGTPVLVELCQAAPASATAACAVLATREAVILTFCLLVCLPLAGSSRVHALRWTNALSFAAVVAVALVVVSHPPSPSAPPVPDTSPLGLLLALPIVVYAYGNHVQAVSIFLDSSEAVQRSFHAPVLICFTFVTMLYVATGVAGVLAFGGAVQGDILSNLSGDGAAAAKFLMAVHLALVIPLDAIPLRRSFSLVLAEWRGQPATDADASLLADSPEDEAAALRARAEAALRAEEALPRVCGTPCSPAIAGQTVVFIVGAATLACALPSVTTVFGLFGCTTGVTCVVSYPALLLSARADEAERRAGGLDGALGSGSEEDKDSLRFWVSPRTPFWMRVHSRCLHFIAACLIALGLAAYVNDTFIAR